MAIAMAEKECAKDRLHLAMISHDTVYFLSTQLRRYHMLDQTIVIYCICDEVSKFLKIQDDLQSKMTVAEVMTFALMSATLFGGDYRRTHLIARHHRYFPGLLSHSRLVRRIHSVPDHAWTIVFLALRLFLRNKKQETFIVDSFPVKAYENHKSFRARIFSGKKYHGYAASKKQYFFGIKVHMVVDFDGVPIEFIFTPGSASDVKSLKELPLELPKNSILLGDKAYTNYSFEDILLEIEGIKLLAKRRENLKRQHSPEDNFCLQMQRNYIETVFSSIISRMPRYIRARTEKGFCLKILFFILAYMVNKFFPLV